MPICHCKKGVMAQCEEADSYPDQQNCFFFEQATKNNKCMFLTETMNNHCWSPGAQSIAAAYGEIDVVDADTEELTLGDIIGEDVDDLPEDKKRPRQYCLDCIHFPCSEVKATERKNNGRKLHEHELWELGTLCDNFSDRKSLAAAINSITTTGGNTP